MSFFIAVLASVVLYLLILTLILTWLPIFPPADEEAGAISNEAGFDFSRGAGVDLIMSGFLIGPFVLSWILSRAFAASACWAAVYALVAMFAYLAAWCVWDQRRRGAPGQFYIWRYWIERDGGLRYTVGWFCTAAIPLFFLIRLCGIIVYPVLNWSWGLPKLHARDYIQLSRYKWKGLVGADLLYCVYCEWMTGVWSLGSAQLQNIETMWCPLRFASEGHCDKCVPHFPDVDLWAKREEGMSGVEGFYRKHYDDRPMLQRTSPSQRLSAEAKTSPVAPAPKKAKAAKAKSRAPKRKRPQPVDLADESVKSLPKKKKKAMSKALAARKKRRKSAGN